MPAILKRLRDMTLLEQGRLLALTLELDAIRCLRDWLGKQILGANSEREFSRFQAIFWHDVRVGCSI
jgi:hypothetical protein